jgi:hypothetical protein
MESSELKNQLFDIEIVETCPGTTPVQKDKQKKVTTPKKGAF